MMLAYLADDLAAWLLPEGLTAIASAVMAVGTTVVLIVAGIGFLRRGMNAQ
jgi:hypothetical protein